MGKGLAIALIGGLAVLGGIAAAAIITKKKLEKDNEADYYDEWDDAEWLDDEDFDFDDAEEIISDVADKAEETIDDAAKGIAEVFAAVDEVNKKNEDLVGEDAASDETEAL